MAKRSFAGSGGFWFWCCLFMLLGLGDLYVFVLSGRFRRQTKELYFGDKTTQIQNVTLRSCLHALQRP